MKAKRPHRPSVRTLKRILDGLWSEWVRRSAADHDGFVTCCSCGRRSHWTQVDCGHFVSRNHNAGRFDIRNTNPQCKKCNRFNEGNKAGYAVFLQKKYGPDIIEELNQLQYIVKRFTPEELQEMVRKVRDDLKALPAHSREF